MGGGEGQTRKTKARQDRRHYVQEPLFPELSKYCCYICSKWIDGEGTYIGQGRWRHKRCRPLPPVSSQ